MFLFWHHLALAIGGCTVEELKVRMTGKEAKNWERFFKIFGPVGDQRMDANFAWLRQVVEYCHTYQPRPVEDFALKYDYKQHFRDAESAVEAMVNNIEKDIEHLVSRFSNKRQAS